MLIGRRNTVKSQLFPVDLLIQHHLHKSLTKAFLEDATGPVRYTRRCAGRKRRRRCEEGRLHAAIMFGCGGGGAGGGAWAAGELCERMALQASSRANSRVQTADKLLLNKMCLFLVFLIIFFLPFAPKKPFLPPEWKTGNKSGMMMTRTSNACPGGPVTNTSCAQLIAPPARDPPAGILAVLVPWGPVGCGPR